MNELEATDIVNAFLQPVDVDAFNATQRGEVYGDAPAMTAVLFAQHIERNTIDLSRSPRWTLGGSLSGVALLGFRGQRAWVGGFGVVPEFRGRGLARRYLHDVISICRDAGAETLELEVLVRNGPAIALYKRGGFAVIDELVVWSRAPLGTDFAQPETAARDEREIARVARTPATCWQREPHNVAAASPCERIIIGDDVAPQAYAFLRRNVDRTTLLDVGARDTSSAELLLDALDAIVPEGRLMLINEPAHGPMHQAFTVRTSWTETTRQHRMCRSLR
ncbi:MAG: hypothetical protein NVSMB64_30080 [Candidatus Velthaea sp.]